LTLGGSIRKTYVTYDQSHVMASQLIHSVTLPTGSQAEFLVPSSTCCRRTRRLESASSSGDSYAAGLRQSTFLTRILGSTAWDLEYPVGLDGGWTCTAYPGSRNSEDSRLYLATVRWCCSLSPHTPHIARYVPARNEPWAYMLRALITTPTSYHV
jgi:hypothetical protein